MSTSNCSCITVSIKSASFWSRICQGRHFECESVGHRLCPGSDRPGPGVGISYANRSIMCCVSVPGGDLPGPRVRWVGGSYVHRFGLAPPRGPSRRGCPGSGVSTSAPTAPVTIGISFGTNSGPGSDPRGRQKFTSVSVVPLSTGPFSVPTTLSSPSSSNFWSSNFWSNPTTYNFY